MARVEKAVVGIAADRLLRSYCKSPYNISSGVSQDTSSAVADEFAGKTKKSKQDDSSSMPRHSKVKLNTGNGFYLDSKMAKVEKAAQVGISAYGLRSSSKRQYNISSGVRQDTSSAVADEFAGKTKKSEQDDSSSMPRHSKVKLNTVFYLDSKMAQVEKAAQVGISAYGLRSSSKRPHNISSGVRQDTSTAVADEFAGKTKKSKQDDSSSMPRHSKVKLNTDHEEGKDKHFSDNSDFSEPSGTSAKFSEPRSSSAPITPSELSDYLRKEGRDSKKVKARLESICHDVKEKYFKENDNIWVGYKLNYKDVPVFVAEVKKRVQDAPEWYNGCELVQRVEEEQLVSPAKDNNNNQRKGKVKLSKEEIMKLCKCMERNTDRLLKSHRNILAIMESDKMIHEKQNQIEERACVVVYVRNKGIIPFYEEEFKLDNNDFPLDVREGRGFTLVSRLSPKEYMKSVRMGCQIESAYGSGTLTGFLELPDGKIGCLTAWHIFDTAAGKHTADLLDSDSFKKNVYQPDKQREDKYKIGRVISVSENFDAALIEIDEPERIPRSGNFPNAVCPEKGYPPSKPMKFDTGNIVNCRDELHSKMSCTVVKYGAVTETTFGNIESLGEHFRLEHLNKRGCNLEKPIFVCTELGKAFCAEGDSGSLVFLEEGKKKELRAIGMLVSKLDSAHNDLTVVMPIWEILKSFKLPLRLLSFEEPWNIGFDQLQAQMKIMRQQLTEVADMTKKNNEAITNYTQGNTNQKR